MRRSRRERRTIGGLGPAVVALVSLALARAAVAEPATAPTADAPAQTGAAAASGANQSTGFLTLNATKSKEPITITSDNLEYQYEDGIVIYRGDVLAVQGDVKVKSNELRITLVKSDDANGKKVTAKAATDLDNADASKLQTVVATGSVSIDQGHR